MFACVPLILLLFSLALRFIIRRRDKIKSFLSFKKRKKASAAPYKCFILSDCLPDGSDTVITDFPSPVRQNKKSVRQ